MTYYKRNIDKKLMEWKASQRRKPLLIRGARQVGKSSAVRTSLENFGEFEYIDKESQDAIRHVDVIPLYAMSNLCNPSVDMEMKVATP